MTDENNIYNSDSGTTVLKATAGKYLTFKLDEEFYGIEILKVQEIMGIISVTKIPKTPDFVRGVINLRGKVIPVMDLRLKFGLESLKDTEHTCIIVVQISLNGQNVTMGIIVDEVSEVIGIAFEQIEEPPTFGTTMSVEFLSGMGKVGEKLIMLLDVDKVLSGKELEILKKV